VIRYSDELACAWVDGSRVDRFVRAVRRWRVRAVSDRLGQTRRGSALVDDFRAILDDEFKLWVRPWMGPASDAPHAASASTDHVELTVVRDVTRGMPHDVAMRPRPRDASRARWTCSCGVSSRGDYPAERARSSADDHVSSALDAAPRPRDVAIIHSWSGLAPGEIAVVRRFWVRAITRWSTVAVHQRGVGEDFELVVDGSLRLWVRRIGQDGFLSTDNDGRGVSILTIESDDT